MGYSKVVIAGSTNMDMVVNAPRIPKPGETILADTFFMNPGGKGANQAVAVARLGGDATFITKVGNDVFGHQSSLLFDEEGIETKYVFTDDENPSGVALITVDNQGENSIVVAPGANSALTKIDFSEVVLSDIEQAEILLMQLEIPMETVFFLADYAYSKNVKVILNPAPMAEISYAVMQKLYLITPNETEAEQLTGIRINSIEDAQKAAVAIHQKGVQNVIITLGSKGALIYENETFAIVDAPKVQAIDTTAAGDVFNGALVVALSEAKTIRESVDFACWAASISVTRPGAQSSIPYRRELITQQLDQL